MPSQTFYWVGSLGATAASLSWNTLSNWKTLTIPNTPGATVARLVDATRFPLGGDVVYFGHSTEPAGKYEPVKPTILSPLMWGGCSLGWISGGTAYGISFEQGATAAWFGSTAGGTTFEREGEIYITVRPTYPFSQIGGDLNTTILNEWAAVARVNGHPNSLNFALSSGTEGTTSAEFYSSNFINDGSFYISRPDQFWNEKYIRVKGTVVDHAKTPTKVYFRGITGSWNGRTGANAGLTGGYKYDGSENLYKRGSAIVRPYETAQNTGTDESNTKVPTPTDGVYTHGSVALSGHWNSVIQETNSVGGDIELESISANLIELSPNHGTVNSGNAYPNHYTTKHNTPSYSGFSMGKLTMSQTSNTRYLIVGTYGTVGYMSHIDGINIEGDITSSGGFACAVPASAGLSGAGGITNVIIPAGSLWLSPPIDKDESNPSVCTIGYPSSSANLRTNNLTTVTNIYTNTGVGPEWHIELQGNVSASTLYAFGGTIYVSPYIENNNTISIARIIANGSTVFDLSRATSYRGLTTDIRCYSTGVRVIPNTGTRISITSDELAQEP